MCQVILAVIEDLTKRLHLIDNDLPSKAIFQFDNSGENKNKEVNALMSTLVEKVIFDEIHCNFLVVGHTHCSVDQYFGVCTKIIINQRWIGSPLSFQNLLKTAHSDVTRRPTVNRQIYVIYDFRNYFKPIINKIGWCQVPHCFKFTRYLGKAIMQYKMFSPNQFWLPEKPGAPLRTEEDLWKYPISNVELSEFCSIDSEKELEISLGVHNKKLVDGVSEPELRKILANFSKVRPMLTLLEQQALIQQKYRYAYSVHNIFTTNRHYFLLHDMIRNMHESEHGDEGSLRRYNSNQIDRNLLNDFMRASSKGNKGFIVYLKPEAKEYLDSHQPFPVITFEQINGIIDSDISNNCDSDESENDVAGRKKRKPKLEVKQLLSRAKTIMRTAKAVLKHLESGHYISHDGHTFQYHNKIFNIDEAEFYARNNSVDNVLGNYLEELGKMPALFQWIPVEVFSEEQLQQRELKKMKSERYYY